MRQATFYEFFLVTESQRRHDLVAVTSMVLSHITLGRRTVHGCMDPSGAAQASPTTLTTSDETERRQDEDMSTFSSKDNHKAIVKLCHNLLKNLKI